LYVFVAHLKVDLIDSPGR